MSRRKTSEKPGCQDLPAYASTEMPFSIALMIVVNRASSKWMEDHNVPEPDRALLWKSRKNCPNPNNAKVEHYRARPLNGVWATAPYLHNGSVPSLYWMLTPAAERPTQFCIGSRDFDPQQVGYRAVAGETPVCNKGETLFSRRTPTVRRSTATAFSATRWRARRPPASLAAS